MGLVFAGGEEYVAPCPRCQEQIGPVLTVALLKEELSVHLLLKHQEHVSPDDMEAVRIGESPTP